MLMRFDSDAFIAQRERLINSLAGKSPEEYAALFGQTGGQGASTLHPAASAVQSHPATPRPRAGLSCGGRVALIFLIVLVTGIVGSLVTDDREATTQEQPRCRRTPHEFGWAMGRELLKSATADSGSGGFVLQSCLGIG